MCCTSEIRAVRSAFAVFDVFTVFDVCVIAVCVGRVAISLCHFSPLRGLNRNNCTFAYKEYTIFIVLRQALSLTKNKRGRFNHAPFRSAMRMFREWSL